MPLNTVIFDIGEETIGANRGAGALVAHPPV